MKNLKSKIQLNNFETGEFSEIKDRNETETIELIENFPWSEQRKKIQIGLTNPSITIENENGDYLKISTYYNGKFAIRYLTSDCKLYIKSINNISESFFDVTKFFVCNEFDTSDYKKEKTHLKVLTKYFATNKFEYKITKKIALRYLIANSIINFCFSAFMISILILKGIDLMPFFGIIVTFALIFLFGGGINILLFFHFYYFAKNRILIMSKGNDNFYYGIKGQINKYNKNDIINCQLIKNNAPRSPIYDFVLLRIFLKDNVILDIPNIFVSEFNLSNKLEDYDQIVRNRIPLIKHK